MPTKKDLHEAEHRLLKANADVLYQISRKGDLLAKKTPYKSLSGMDAVIRHLCDKHHWFPHDVRRLTVDDLSLLLEGDA